jgi:hypothetical protein
MNLVWFSLSFVFISPQRSFYLDLGGKFCSSCKKVKKNPETSNQSFIFYLYLLAVLLYLTGPVFFDDFVKFLKQVNTSYVRLGKDRNVKKTLPK